MKIIEVTSTEVVERVTRFEVPDYFDAANERHRDVIDDSAMDYECGESSVSRTISIAPAAGPGRIDAELDEDDLPAADEPAAAPTSSWGTWTFLGHWENDEIVVDHTVDGEVEDIRDDDGRYEQGLWADAGSGPTQDAALAELKRQYENN